VFRQWNWLAVLVDNRLKFSHNGSKEQQYDMTKQTPFFERYMMDDNAYIKKCLAGDKDSYEPLVRQYQGLVYSLARNTLHTPGDASDVTQEVFLKVWTNLWRFDEQYSFKSWIARITVNHCININRKKKVLTIDSEDVMGIVPATEGLPEQLVVGAEQKKAIKNALDRLPEMYRIPILLYHQQNLTYDEICKTLGLPMTLVKNRIYRARKILAQTLSEYQDERITRMEDARWVAKEHGNI